MRSIGEECIQEDELRNLLAKKPEPICYDGFEPSGRMHIAQVCSLSILVSCSLDLLAWFRNPLSLLTHALLPIFSYYSTEYDAK